MATQSDQRDRCPSGSVRVRYIIALTLVALLSTCTFIGVELLLMKEAGSHTRINIAGRQRMLSQRIAKAAAVGDVAQMTSAVDQLTDAHNNLLYGNDELGLPSSNSSQTERLFASLDQDYEGLVRAARTLASDPESDARGMLVADILRYEAEFLPQMHAIVEQYELDASNDTTRLMWVEFGLLCVTLTVLGLEVAVVFEPAARKLKRQWNELREREVRYELAVQGSRDAIWDWDTTTERVYYSPRWAALFRDERFASASAPEAWIRLIASSEMTKFDLAIRALRDGRSDGLDLEMEMRTADGNTVWVLCRGAAHRDETGRVVRMAGSVADITDQRAAQDELRALAERDALTGLCNRSLFHQRVELAVSKGHREGRHNYATLLMDFDGFKAVNDALGHSVGDDLLKSVAQRLTEMVPEPCTIARLGGDEFAVLLERTNLSRVSTLCDKMVETFRNPHHLGVHEVVSTASIGVLMGTDACKSAEDAIQCADVAMYAAKTGGKSQARLFDQGMREMAVRRLHIERALRKPSIFDELELLYQPLVRVEDGVCEGCEALIRWRSDEGTISPDLFIPIAEETGSIIEIGAWLLHDAAKTLRKWDTQLGHRRTTIHVNVSKRQFMHPSFLRTLEEVNATFPEHQGRLILEITETAVMDRRSNIRPRMTEVKKLGFPLALDDFGTGHSSLSCLHQFPLDCLKIDRSFILNVEERREFSAVMQAIVQLADNLNLSVVAEGVETQGQLAQLQAMDCEFAQGYYFAKPLAADHALRFLMGDKQVRFAA